MNKNVVRIQTELFRAGAVVQGRRLDVYVEPPGNSVWWPRQPRYTWLNHTEAGPGNALRFEDGGFFFTFAALGIEINGRTSGDIDYLMHTRSAAELFRVDLPNFALLSRQRFESLLNQACWATLAVYDVDVESGTVEFYAGLDLETVDQDAEATEGEAS